MGKERKELQKQVKKWINIAEEDIRLAKFAFKMKSNIPYRLICYHSQQAAEKYLKAFLVSRMIDFPYHHNIELLVNLCSNIYDIKQEVKDSFALSKYAIAKRYPGEYQKINKNDAVKCVASAEKVILTIKVLLEKDGFSI